MNTRFGITFIWHVSPAPAQVQVLVTNPGFESELCAAVGEVPHLDFHTSEKGVIPIVKGGCEIAGDA